MNYLINMYSYLGRSQGPLDYLYTFICFALIMAIIGLLVWLSKKTKISDRLLTGLVVIVFLLTFPPFIFGSIFLKDFFNQGAIKEVFIQNSGQELKVWLNRRSNNRLKTFEFKSGRLISSKDTNKSNSYAGKYGWRNREDRFSKPGWQLRRASKSLGYTFSLRNQPVTNNSLKLLNPRLLEELNKRASIKNKAWIAHQSILHLPYENLLTYVNSSGQAINTLNLNKLFKKGKIKRTATYTTPNMVQPIATYSNKDEVIIFISCGETMFSDHYGFTLTALRCDAKTGQILDQIDYIK